MWNSTHDLAMNVTVNDYAPRPDIFFFFCVETISFLYDYIYFDMVSL